MTPRPLAELLAEARARTVKGHRAFYKPFAPSDARVLRACYAAQVPFLDPHQTLFTRGGIRLANGFTRVVIGDYGAYVEIAPEQINRAAITPRFGHRAPSRPVKYIWLVVIGEPRIKVYEQRGTVAYADYRIGMYYAAPDAVRPHTPP